MKRKWIWTLAVLPLVFGLISAQARANQTPQLIARDFVAAEIVISADEKQLFASWGRGGETLQIAGGARAKVWSDSIDPYIGFSPGGKWLYQLDLDSYEGSFNWDGVDFRSPRPDGKIGIVGRDARNGSKTTIRFTFTGDRKDFFGAYVRGDEIIAESREMTYYLDAHDLKVLRTEPQKRASMLVFWLFADGKTVLRSRNGLETADLQTGKTLWKWPMRQYTPLRLTRSGNLALSAKNGEVRAYDARTGGEAWRLRGPQSSLVAVSPDASAVYEARPNGELWKWAR